VHDHCPLISVPTRSATYNSSILSFFHVHVFLKSQAASITSLGHTCYLELARGLANILHVGPPRDGGPRAIPVVLKKTIHVLLPSCLDTS
jgi:hypothetical protein